MLRDRSPALASIRRLGLDAAASAMRVAVGGGGTGCATQGPGGPSFIMSPVLDASHGRTGMGTPVPPPYECPAGARDTADARILPRQSPNAKDVSRPVDRTAP